VEGFRDTQHGDHISLLLFIKIWKCASKFKQRCSDSYEITQFRFTVTTFCTLLTFYMKSRTSEQFFLSVYRVHLSAVNILMQVGKVLYIMQKKWLNTEDVCVCVCARVLFVEDVKLRSRLLIR
jgi:hypothetical protein